MLVSHGSFSVGNYLSTKLHIILIITLFPVSFKAKRLDKNREQDTLKRPYMSGIMGIVMKLGLTQWESTNRVRLGTKQH